MKHILFLFTLLVLALTSIADEIYWDRFRGPNGQGIMEAAEPPVELDVEKNLAWKTPLPPGHSSPVIWGDKIFLTSYEDDQLSTIGIDRKNGEVLWKQSIPYVPLKDEKFITKLHNQSSPAAATICLDDKHVYVYFWSYGIVCYDHTGNEKWKTPFSNNAMFQGSGASPLVYRDTVFVLRDCFEKDPSYLFALDSNTGEEKWKVHRSFSMASWSTPIIRKTKNHEEIIVLGADNLFAYDISNGEVIWFWNELKGLPISVPVITKDEVYISAKMGMGLEIEYEFDKVWEYFLTFDENQNGKIERTEIKGGIKFPQRPELHSEAPGFGMPMNPDMMMGNDKNDDDSVSFDEFKIGVNNFLSGGKKATFARINIENVKGEVNNHVVWDHQRYISEVPSILLYQDRLYSVDNGGIYVCRDIETGDVIKRARLKDAGGLYVSSPVAAYGHIYFCSNQGIVSVMKGDGSFETMHQLDLDELIYATPAIQDNSIYIRTNNYLYAFGE